MGEQQVQPRHLPDVLEVTQILVDDPLGVLAQPAAVETLLSAQEGLGESSEAEQMGDRPRVWIPAALRERERMQAVVVVPPLQRIAVLAVVVQAGGTGHQEGDR